MKDNSEMKKTADLLIGTKAGSAYIEQRKVFAMNDNVFAMNDNVFAVSGKQLAANKKQFAISEKQPAATKKQFAMNEKQPAASKKQLAASHNVFAIDENLLFTNAAHIPNRFIIKVIN